MNGPSTDNPYQAPVEIEDQDRPAVQSIAVDDGIRRNCIFAWSVILPINLIVPGLIAMGMLAPTGWIGVLPAVLAIYAIGLWVCYRHTNLAVRVTIGGSIVAFFQFVPILHLFAGIVGFEVVGATFDHGGGPSLGPVQAFAITLIVAAILLTVSVVIGAILTYIKKRMA
ncbi:hypothetical protein LOC67_04225 [Stieleria sp. JC731]|uniref:hypothetical protein n=1 Tax=Pirellulaceae TaxID=2691357 RepID=UPI001E604B3C|nr:hypothetical protein [Stieleria sp. JC731]MCC9599758.1 hypothetical protein [Stieleria sp. JC731]